MSAILDALQFAGNVLDTPGSVARGLLAGEGGRAMRGVFNPDERVGGREMLQNWGVLGENTEGLDWGDVAGFGAEMVADPLNFIGGTGLLKALRNPKMVLQKGPHHITDDVLQNTKVVDELGKPKRLYHGTSKSYDWPDVNRVSGENLYGQGFYMTDNPAISSSLNDPHLYDYATARALGHKPPKGWGDFAVSSDPERKLGVSADRQLLDSLGIGPLEEGPIPKTGSYIEARLHGELTNKYLAERFADGTEAKLKQYSYSPAQAESLQNQADVARRKAEVADSLYPVNTRINYADVRRPLDMQAMVDPAVRQDLARILQQKYGHAPAWEHGVDGHTRQLPLKNLEQQFASAQAPSTGDELYQDIYKYLPTDYINPLLSDAGYDGITHVGGKIMGKLNQVDHQVWIPFSHDQLYLPFIPPRVPEMNRAVAPLVGALGTQNALRPWGE